MLAQFLPLCWSKFKSIFLTFASFLGRLPLISAVFTAFLVQDTINVSRGDGKDSNPKGINRLSREFQYLISFPFLLPSGDRSADERDDQRFGARQGWYLVLDLSVALYFALNWIELVGC